MTVDLVPYLPWPFKSHWLICVNLNFLLSFNTHLKPSYKKLVHYIPRLGIQIRNMKMVVNIYGTWHWVMFEKLGNDGRFYTQYYMGWLNNLAE